MTLSVNTNIPALFAQANLQRSSSRFNASLERLATGLRINHSADDPSGLVISEFQRAQLAGLSAADANIDRALSLSQTADGGLSEVSRLLTELRGLVIDSANNGSLDVPSLEANQANVTNILDTIDRISDGTQFGRQSLLDGRSGRNGLVNSGTSTGEIEFLRAVNDDVIVNRNLPIVVTRNAERAHVEGAAFAGGGPALTQDEVLIVNGVEIRLGAGLNRAQVVDEINRFSGQTESFAVEVGNTISIRTTLFGEGAEVSVISTTGESGFATASVIDLGVDAEGTIGGGVASGGSKAGAALGLGRLLIGQRGEAGSGIAIQLGLANETDITTSAVTAANNASVTISDQSRVFQIGATVGDNARLTLPTVNTRALGIGLQPRRISSFEQIVNAANSFTIGPTPGATNFVNTGGPPTSITYADTGIVGTAVTSGPTLLPPLPTTITGPTTSTTVTVTQVGNQTIRTTTVRTDIVTRDSTPEVRTVDKTVDRAEVITNFLGVDDAPEASETVRTNFNRPYIAESLFDIFDSDGDGNSSLAPPAPGTGVRRQLFANRTRGPDGTLLNVDTAPIVPPGPPPPVLPGPAVRAGFNAGTLARNDDGSTAAAIGFTVNFFGTNFTNVFVNNNGNITFDSPLDTFSPFDLSTTGRVIIAPFFADIDTRDTSGSNAVTFGNGTVGGRPAFAVNWVGVEHFDGAAATKTNDVQLVLIDRSDIAAGDFDIEFNYNTINWETGDASGGTDGLGGNSARAGFSNGGTRTFELAGSGAPGSFLDGGPAALAENRLNSDVLGRYVFEVRSGVTVGTSTPVEIRQSGGGNFTVLQFDVIAQEGASAQSTFTVFDQPFNGVTLGTAEGSVTQTGIVNPPVGVTIDVSLGGTVFADVRGDFLSATNNGDLAVFGATGSGTWTYLTSDTANPQNATNGLPTMVWSFLASGGAYVPGVISPHLPQINIAHPNLNTDEVAIHPAAPPVNTTGFGVSRWTAGPGDIGQIDIQGIVRDLDLGGGDGVTFQIFVDGNSVFSPGVINTSAGQSFDVSAAVGVGSTVDFVVGPNGSEFFDNTGLAVTISSDAGNFRDIGSFLWDMTGTPTDPSQRAELDNILVVPDIRTNNRRGAVADPADTGQRFQIIEGQQEQRFLTVTTIQRTEQVTVEITINDQEPFQPNLRSIDVRSPESAQRALRIVERSIEEVSTFRGEVGALQRNILQTAQSNVRTQFTNLSEAESSLRDTDFTTEVATLVSEQVRQNVGSTILGLANQNSLSILDLLQSSAAG